MIQVYSVFKKDFPAPIKHLILNSIPQCVHDPLQVLCASVWVLSYKKHGATVTHENFFRV